jgi:small subunit ribosomal protein S23
MIYTNKEVLLFHRIRGLLRSGALKEEDKPIWCDVYTAFPPKYEPKYDRPAPDIPLRNILYPEDTIRA